MAHYQTMLVKRNYRIEAHGNNFTEVVTEKTNN